MYEGKLKTQLYYWLKKGGRPFVINNEYQIDLLFIDKEHVSVKLLITNLKTQETQEEYLDVDDIGSEPNLEDKTFHSHNAGGW